MPIADGEGAADVAGDVDGKKMVTTEVVEVLSEVWLGGEAVA